jgi:hypothetical protein
MLKKRRLKKYLKLQGLELFILEHGSICVLSLRTNQSLSILGCSDCNVQLHVMEESGLQKSKTIKLEKNIKQVTNIIKKRTSY